MPPVDNEVHVNTRPGIHVLSRRVLPNQRARAARQPSALVATPELTVAFAMRWSTGPDGRLYCAWHRPTARKTDETKDPVGWSRAELAGREQSMLACDRIPEALAAC
jgi:hypothetical protein